MWEQLVDWFAGEQLARGVGTLTGLVVLAGSVLALLRMLRKAAGVIGASTGERAGFSMGEDEDEAPRPPASPSVIVVQVPAATAPAAPPDLQPAVPPGGNRWLTAADPPDPTPQPLPDLQLVETPAPDAEPTPTRAGGDYQVHDDPFEAF